MNKSSNTSGESVNTRSSKSTKLRDKQLKELKKSKFDVLVIGGGINGASSAAALSAHGYKVALVDSGDFASSTSQASSNLVWGGIKYLQTFELGLVKGLCKSRNQLMKAYPSQIKEIDFLATIGKSAPAITWLFPFGSLFYWAIGSFFTKKPRPFSTKAIKKLEPNVNVDSSRFGVRYGDGHFIDHDARFVWGLISKGLENGSTACNYVKVVNTKSLPDKSWSIELVDQVSGEEFSVEANAIVNAAGPYVDGINAKTEVKTKNKIVLSKGIHLIVDAVVTSKRVLGFYDDDGRLFYVIPMAHRSVIGTTDTPTTDAREGVTQADRDFLISQINDRLDLDAPLTDDDIISTRCGVRPLVTEASKGETTDESWFELSRKHVMETDAEHNLVSIFGGKLTDCINIGNEVLDAAKQIELKPSALVDESIAGGEVWYGEPDIKEKAAFIKRAKSLGLGKTPEVERVKSLAEVLWLRHASSGHKVLDLIESDASLAEPVLPECDISFAELKVMAENEMIVSVEDFLRRRTKLVLIHRKEDIEKHKNYKKILEALGCE